MLGYIHSVESFATLDGGGIRFAVFMQGCPLRCVYCHNPDTQPFSHNNPVTAAGIVAKVERNKNYYIGGGVTISGGEPLMQSEFVLELAREIKTKLNLNVAIDTSLAIIPDNFIEIINNTDLFIVDLKFHDEICYNKYCGASLGKVIAGMRILDDNGAKMLIRTVIVPGINDTEEHIDKYYDIIKQFNFASKYELLGYHTLGVYKYEESGVEYQLKGVPPLEKAVLIRLQKYLDELMNTN